MERARDRGPLVGNRHRPRPDDHRAEGRRRCAARDRERLTWTRGTRPSRPSCAAPPRQLARQLGPATVAGLDDDDRRAAARRRGARRGLARAARRRGRRRAARRRRRGGDRRRGARRRRSPTSRSPARCSRATSCVGPARGADAATVVVRADLTGAAIVAGVHDRRAGARRRLRCRRRRTALRAAPRRRELPAADGSRSPQSSCGTDLTRAVRHDPPRGSPVEPVDGATDAPTTSPTWTALGLALTSADLVGVMRGVLDVTVAYAAERRQYGVPVGSFQAVQHLLAEARCLMEGSLSVALHASWAVDNLAGRRGRGRPGRQGVLRPRRAHGVRDRGAGARRHRQHVGVHRARLPAARAALVAVVRRRRRRSSRELQRERLGVDRWTFVTRPAEAEFRARFRAWLAAQQPRPAGVVDRRRVLGPPGRVAHRARTTRASSA